MGTINLNFGGVGKIPDEGVHLFEIVSAKVKPTKAKDSQNLNVQLKCIEMSDQPEFEGHTVWETLSLKEGARWKVQEFLEAFTGESWEEDEMELDIDVLPGLTSYGVAYHDEYNGKVSLKVKTWLGSDPGVAQASESSSRSL